MKKSLAILLALCLMLGSAACGGSPSPDDGSSNSAQKQEITFWMLPLIDESSLRAMVDEFNAQSETTKVNLTVLDWGTGREQIKQAVASGSGPDAFYVSAGLDTAYIDGSLLLPLDKNGYRGEDLDRYSTLIEAAMVDGSLYASPIVYENYILYYRTDVLEQFGFNAPPKTWDELKTMAKTISDGSKGSIMGFQFKGADDQLNAINLTWQSLLSQNGCDIMDLASMKSTEDTPKAREVLSFMKSFYDEGISVMGTSSNNGFREGKVAMYMFTPGPLTSEGFIGDQQMEGKWALAPLPQGSAKGGGYLSGHAVAVNSGTKHAENAVEFVKWFTSPENAPNWLQKFYGVQPFDLDKLSPEQKGGIEGVFAASPEIWGPITESAAMTTPDLMIQNRYGYTARWDGQKRLIIAALTGEMTVEEALKQLDIEINQAL